MGDIFAPLPPLPKDLDIEQWSYYVEKHCDDAANFKHSWKIGQGTFGDVYRSRHRVSETQVALKRIKAENNNEGLPTSVYSEIRLLNYLQHENIVRLHSMCKGKTCEYDRESFYLVFEYCETDLSKILVNSAVRISTGEIKNILQQILIGVHFMHSNKILHLDIKPGNILVSEGGIVKIADLGLAKDFNEGMGNERPYAVVTRYYRPPEILLGDTKYYPAVDMWSLGCTTAELWKRRPLFPGNNPQEQLKLISSYCGSMTPETWNGVQNLPLYERFKKFTNGERKVKDILANLESDPRASLLLDGLLVLDPTKRLTAEEALRDEFFRSDPKPAGLGAILKRNAATSPFYIPSESGEDCACKFEYASDSDTDT